MASRKDHEPWITCCWMSSFLWRASRYDKHVVLMNFAVQDKSIIIMTPQTTKSQSQTCYIMPLGMPPPRLKGTLGQSSALAHQWLSGCVCVHPNGAFGTLQWYKQEGLPEGSILGLHWASGSPLRQPSAIVPTWESSGPAQGSSPVCRVFIEPPCRPR